MCFGSKPPRAAKLPVRKFPLEMAYGGDPKKLYKLLDSIYGGRGGYELKIAQGAYVLRAKRSLTPDESRRVESLRDHYEQGSKTAML
ncbi:hypothetical protein OQA88_8724 [Cercophora sp. LCS_1]